MAVEVVEVKTSRLVTDVRSVENLMAIRDKGKRDSDVSMYLIIILTFDFALFE